MNNDLISREALKNYARTVLCEDSVTNASLIRVFDEIIDNAPTVEITEEQAIDKLHETGWLIRHAKEMTERPQGWIPVSERLPEEKLFNPSGSDFGFDFEEVLCTTIWGDVRAYKFGKPRGHDKPHFWLGGGIMDEYVIAWQYKPEPYMKGGAKE